MSKEKETLKNHQYNYSNMVMSIAVSAIVLIACFSLYINEVADVIKELNGKSDSKNLLWLVEYVSPAVPFFGVLGVIEAFYKDKSKHCLYYTQKEKLYVYLFTVAFLAVMLLYVLSTDGKVDSSDGIKTLFEQSAVWFAAQILPFLIIISYHTIRMENERRMLKEAEEKKQCQG